MSRSTMTRSRRVRTLAPTRPPLASLPIARLAFAGGLVAVAVSILIASLPLLGPTFAVVGLAMFLALSIEPIVRAGEARGIRRPVSVGLISLAVAATGTGLVVAVVPSTVQQVQTFQTALPEIARGVLDQPWVQSLQTTVGTSIDLTTATASVVNFLRDPQQLVALWGGVVAAVSGTATVLLAGVFVGVLAVFFSLALPSMRDAFARSLPASRRASVVSISDEMLTGIGRYVGGQLALSLANGIVVLIVVSAVGGPTPLLLALLCFTVTLVPLVGTPIGFTFATLACFTTSPTAGLVALGALLVYMQIESYVLVPMVMKKAVAVPGSLVIVGAFAGAALGGVLGAFFAVPVIAAASILWRRVLLPRQERR
ncbi:MAG TPA: AI-2E family transporter [Lacisediminihabitans sp.]|uniref:AI-2E family transporter n=1 Tax=Lacisediminihabitans sp. TaxID=2787631 RepID=UPI002EDB2EBD